MKTTKERRARMTHDVTYCNDLSYSDSADLLDDLDTLESRCARQAELLERVMGLLPGFEIGTVFPESVWTQHPEISYRDIQREKDLIKEAKILLADYEAFRKEAGPSPDAWNRDTESTGV